MVVFSPKDWDWVRKSLGGRGQPETVGWTFHVTLCVAVCYLCNSLGGSKMDY